MMNAKIGVVFFVMRRNVGWGVHYMLEDDQLEYSLVETLKGTKGTIFFTAELVDLTRFFMSI
ncbi:hypothetical protein Fmac_017892 [Flemingia macrophylla]|uniref:Uncharacterized protein n=1 Tax=Flemingia macrophylla TaxID=520843 RepID=A0ABD1M3H1_9FABA